MAETPAVLFNESPGLLPPAPAVDRCGMRTSDLLDKIMRPARFRAGVPQKPQSVRPLAHYYGADFEVDRDFRDG